MHTEGTFTGCGGFNLYYQCWQAPSDSPRAVLVMAHGLAEHSGRYLNLVNYFIPRGYEVWAFDYEGHGKSGGRRGHVRRFANYVQDLETFLQMVAQKRPGSRIFLVGHSMGGPVAALAALHQQQVLAGLIVSGPTFQHSLKAPQPLKTVVRVLSLLMPRIGVTVIDASGISRDAGVVSAYVSDPLVHRGKISARLASEIVAAGEQASRQARLLSLPLLILQGSADRLCSPQGSKVFYQQAGSKDKTLKLYDGFYHEVYNEPGHEEVLKDVEEWVEGRVERKS
jgi:acylglycerol lipase